MHGTWDFLFWSLLNFQHLDYFPKLRADNRFVGDRNALPRAGEEQSVQCREQGSSLGFYISQGFSTMAGNIGNTVLLIVINYCFSYLMDLSEPAC